MALSPMRTRWWLSYLRGDAAEDLGRLLDARRLEVIVEKRRMIDAVAVVDLAHALGRRRRDDADLAAREQRLQELAHARALHALAEERVEVLDDEDALGVGAAAELVDERLEALLDLAAELGAGDERAGVELEQRAPARGSTGTSPWAMRSARPRMSAVLPTPGSPTMSGWFLKRRSRIWSRRRASTSRPMTGSKRALARVGDEIARVGPRAAARRRRRRAPAPRAGARARPR